MATVPDSQPTSLSQRVTTAPSNDISVTIVSDSDDPGGISQKSMSLGRPSEDH